MNYRLNRQQFDLINYFYLGNDTYDNSSRASNNTSSSRRINKKHNASLKSASARYKDTELRNLPHATYIHLFSQLTAVAVALYNRSGWPYTRIPLPILQELPLTVLLLLPTVTDIYL